MPKLHATAHRDDKGRFHRVTIFGSPYGHKLPDKDLSASELMIEFEFGGLKATVTQATNPDGSIIAPDYWKPGQMLIEHPHGVRALRDALTKFLDRFEDESEGE